MLEKESCNLNKVILYTIMTFLQPNDFNTILLGDNGLGSLCECGFSFSQPQHLVSGYDRKPLVILSDCISFGNHVAVFNVEKCNFYVNPDIREEKVKELF